MAVGLLSKDLARGSQRGSADVRSRVFTHDACYFHDALPACAFALSALEATVLKWRPIYIESFLGWSESYFQQTKLPHTHTHTVV